MAELSGFLPSVNGDGKKGYQFLASWIAALISNGTYNGELQASPAGDMNIQLPKGRAWINGFYYENTATLTKTIAHNTGAQPRIDSLILRLDANLRKILSYLVQGVPALEPIPPEITRNENVYELRLANIRVNAGAVYIDKKDITITNANTRDCGIVTCIVDHVDSSKLFDQIEAIKAELIKEIIGIQQGSAVMLKSVYGGKAADSVKKADELTSTLAIASGGTGTTSLALLKSALAIDKVSNIPDADKSVKSAGACTGNAATATNATDHINNRSNPHGTNKNDVGLGNVDNTADNVKSVSYAATAGRANSAGSADSAGTATTAGRANTAGSADSAGHADRAGSAIKSTYTTFEIGTSKIQSQGNQQTVIQSGDESYQVCVGVSPTQGWSVYPFATEMPSPTQRPCPGMLLGTNALPWSGVYSKTSLSQVSDKREKHDIKPLNAKYVDFVLSVNPSEFILNSDTDNKISLGFIAQEIEQNLKAAGIEPERMNVLKIPKGKDGKYNLCYSDFIAPLVLTVQAQQQQINQLSARLDALEAKK